MKRVFRVVVLLALGSMAACASGGPTGDQDDAGVSDAAPIDAFDLGGFGVPCEYHTECEDGFCYRPNLSDAMGTCTKECTGSCPDGYACKLVPIAEGTDARLCVPAQDTMCKTCTANADCGDTGDFCVQFTGGNFCTVDCSSNPTVCPAGFTCQQVTGANDTVVGEQCMPLNGLCCIDGDGDMRGEGDNCLTTDCDDTNDKVYDDAAEVCDGFDNDCVGGVDVDVTDCQSAECKLGGGGYFQREAEPCESGACTPQTAVQCGKYTCADGGENGDVCATSCESAPGIDDDARCISTAHCDGGVCEDDYPDGQACNEPSDCQSGHCNNGFCCAFGDCCSVASDCPTFGSVAPVCDNPQTCQGTRGEAVCGSNFVCSTTGIAQDDSACTTAIEANDCGFYKSVMCQGGDPQTADSCKTTCTSDADCDDNAYCDATSSQCLADKSDGFSCDDTDGQGDAECSSDHCQNGFCCTGTDADCCDVEEDCPASYTGAATCDVLSACRGSQDIASCNNNVCTTVNNERNDEACTPTSGVAKDCGFYKDLYCAGGPLQNEPTCPTSCASDADCDDNGHCSAGQCIGDKPDGGVCDNTDGQGAAECQANRCNNGFCCSSGTCCSDNNDCGAFDTAPECVDEPDCQGLRYDGVCTASKNCTTQLVSDDSSCAGIVADECGLYPSIVCTADPFQSPQNCLTSCNGDQECDPSARCDNGSCVPRTGPGGACTGPGQCDAGLTCVDGVCCTSACTGDCMRCDLSGNGTCTPAGAGTDPDDDCGGFDCSGYYHGWTGDSCFRKANVTDSAARCDGAGSCRSQAVECGLAGKGSLYDTCDSLCQDPNLATCSGTSAGICTNVTPSPPTTSCGSGPCQRTVQKCTNGSPNSCTPDWSQIQTETCNGVDDNCNGSVDDGLSADVWEPNSYSAPRSLTQTGSGDHYWAENMTIYPYGDVDYYRASLVETDNTCGCGFSFDEDYRIWVGLTVPAGAGSYQLCFSVDSSGYTETCTTVPAGGANPTWIYQWLDGACPGNDDYELHIRVMRTSGSTPGYSCVPYRLERWFEYDLCN